MAHVLEVKDQEGKKIRLTKEPWRHITTKHPEMIDKFDEIRRALQQPQVIVPHAFDAMKRNYYLFLKRDRMHLLVAVKYLNGEGYVTTAFMTQSIRRR